MDSLAKPQTLAVCGLGQFPVRLFQDLAVRHGIKCGLSALIAWWAAQVVRLPNPTWALITVFVLALSPFVGSMGEKGVLRIVGTAIGGFLGMVLIGNFADSMWITLGGTFILLTVSTWLFGSNRFPYAFFLCALTLNVVVSASLHDPDYSWSVALHRFLEVSLGVCATLLVNGILWPRYARFEFREKLFASFGEIQALFAETIRAEPADQERIRATEQTYLANLAAMRLLLRFGAAESLPFRRRTGLYMQLIPEMSLLFLSVFALRRTGGSETLAGNPETSEILGDVAGIERELLKLWEAVRDRKSRSAEVERDALQAIEAVKALLGEWLEHQRCHDPEWKPSDAVIACSALVVTLDDIYYHLHRIEGFLRELEKPNPNAGLPVELYAWSPRLRAYWLRSAIKGAIATCAALILCDWLNPPGATMVPLAAWVMVVLSRGYVLGEGDRRCFHYAAVTGFVLLGFSLFALVFTPLMASYAVSNVTLFVALFIFGYVAVKKGGVTFSMQIGMLSMVSLFGLNPQEPVTFQATAGVFFGILLGVLLGAVVQRLIWPLLPARELQHAVIEFLEACREFPSASGDERFLRLKSILALTPSEMSNWASRLDTREVPVGEQAKWADFITTLRETSGSIRALQRLFQDPAMEVICQKLEPQLRSARVQLEKNLETLIAAFEAGSTGSLAAPGRPGKDHESDSLLALIHEGDLSSAEMSQLLGLAHRWRLVDTSLLRSKNAAAALDLPQYLGDYAL